MKIAITAQDDKLSSQVDHRFGQAEWLIVADSETGEVYTHHNNIDIDAYIFGVQTVQNVIELHVEAAIAGNVVPNALTVLDASGVKVFLTVADTVTGALALLKSGKLNQVNEGNVSMHRHAVLNYKQEHPTRELATILYKKASSRLSSNKVARKAYSLQ